MIIESERRKIRREERGGTQEQSSIMLGCKETYSYM